jgi:hypothetical protein
MASERGTVHTGRRLVAGGASDAASLQVFAVGDLASALAGAFAAMLLVSLIVAAFVAHGRALAYPLLAVAVGALWGRWSFRRREHPDAERFPALADSAIVRPVGEITLVYAMRILFMAAAPAAIIAGAGHGAPAALVAAACVPPLLSARMLTEALMARRGAVRYRALHAATLVQSAGSSKSPARLYSAEIDRRAV